jgi:hypothetical protein
MGFNYGISDKCFAVGVGWEYPWDISPRGKHGDLGGCRRLTSTFPPASLIPQAMAEHQSNMSL